MSSYGSSNSGSGASGGIVPFDGGDIADAVASPLPHAAMEDLRAAYEALERGPGLVVRLAEAVSGFVGHAGFTGLRAAGMIPGSRSALRRVAEAALRRAYDVAVVGVGEGKHGRRRRSRLPGTMATVSGAVGGFVGLAGFLPDAAVTTVAIMREIAEIARANGEDVAREDTRRACLEVFALRVQPAPGSLPSQASSGGAPGEPGTGREVVPRDEVGGEWGYYATRLAFQGQPLVALLASVASRYGIQLGQKLAAQAVPVVGALCGAALNRAFLSHYRTVAEAHFTVRRLERVHGAGAVRAAWTQLGSGAA